ncbi:Pro-kumamolisin, activation domain-containing protein [Lactarius hatsudake]|nr:Pro-kumamolisin, activation domain-containing protein [Lactarius hatsudake]
MFESEQKGDWFRLWFRRLPSQIAELVYQECLGGTELVVIVHRYRGKRTPSAHISTPLFRHLRYYPRSQLRQSVEPPHNWVNLGRAPSSYIIPLPHLSEISDRFHRSYGKHISKEDVEALVAPPASSVDAVHEWLESYGVQKGACHMSPAGDWVTVRLPVAHVEMMLGTVATVPRFCEVQLTFQEFRMWMNADDRDGLGRTTQYSLPPHLDEHIELIQPLTIFIRGKALRTTYHFTDLDSDTAAFSQSKITVPGSRVTVDASCNNSITVSCLKQLYNAVDYVPQFYADQVPAAVNLSFIVVLINDVQFALGITFKPHGTFYSTGGGAPFINVVSMPDATTNLIDMGVGGRVGGGQPKSLKNFRFWAIFLVQRVHKGGALVAHKLSQALLSLSGAHGVSFSSSDGGIGDGDPDPATQICFTNHGQKRDQISLSVSLRPVCMLPQSAAPPTFPKSLLTFQEAGSATMFYPLRHRQSDGHTSAPTPILARRCSHQVLRIATGGHLCRALQWFGPIWAQFRERVLNPTTHDRRLIAIPGRLNTGRALPDLPSGVPCGQWRNIGVGTISRRLCALLNDAWIAAGKPSLFYDHPDRSVGLG